MPNYATASPLSGSNGGQLNHNNAPLFYYHAQFKKKHKGNLLSLNNVFDDASDENFTLDDINNNYTLFNSSLPSTLLFSPEIDQKKSSNIYRVLIFTESFHPYTSGIARRFKEILQRLSKCKHFLIHVVTGCKV